MRASHEADLASRSAQAVDLGARHEAELAEQVAEMRVSNEADLASRLAERCAAHEAQVAELLAYHEADLAIKLAEQSTRDESKVVGLRADHDADLAERGAAHESQLVVLHVGHEADWASRLAELSAAHEAHVAELLFYREAERSTTDESSAIGLEKEAAKDVEIAALRTRVVDLEKGQSELTVLRRMADTLMQPPDTREVAVAAYFYANARGFRGGSEREDWLRAENEIRVRTAASQWRELRQRYH